jgi:DNA repair exonuclease SbcCD ATPase subunit
MDVQDLRKSHKVWRKTRRAATMQSISVWHPDMPEILKHKYKEEEKSQPAFSKEQEVIEEKDRRLREAEEKKEGGEKALQEKAVREASFKERQELHDRIANLQEQIRAKEEEQGNHPGPLRWGIQGNARGWIYRECIRFRLPRDPPNGPP